MLVTIAVILLICWALGLFVFNVGALIHVLLVIAIVVVLIRIIQGRRPVARRVAHGRSRLHHVRLLLFVIDDVQYALRTEAVAEIVRAVAVTPLPNAPAVIEGIIDLRGRVAPVFDLRLRFGGATRPVDVSDHFIIVRASTRMAALHVDRVLDLIDVDDTSVDQIRAQVSSSKHVAGVALLPDGMALIHDVDTFLSAAEAETLDAALEASARAD